VIFYNNPKMKKFTNYITEATDLKGDVLVIVDVQKEFSKFIPKDYVYNLNKYAEEFPTVYQIWDGHSYDGEQVQKINGPSYKFNNEKDSFRKVYGTSASKKVTDLGERALNYKKNVKEGDIFRVNDDFKLDEKGENYIVRIENNHKWFYINKELANFFKSLKGQDIIIVGGADGECLEDVIVAMKSFGVRPTPNYTYIYSADTSNKQKFRKTV